jgi:hypothetical protein
MEALHRSLDERARKKPVALARLEALARKRMAREEPPRGPGMGRWGPEARQKSAWRVTPSVVAPDARLEHRAQG